MATQQHAVIARITHGITRGEYPVGSYLPAATELARRTRCSAHAVRRAYRVLSDQGVLHSTKRKGTRVVLQPTAGRVLFMLGSDMHTNVLLQAPVAEALVQAGFDVEFLPFAFGLGTTFDRLRQQALKAAPQTVLVTLTPEAIAADHRPAWEQFAAAFAGRVSYQYEDGYTLPGSTVIMADQLVAARLVAAHLLGLGHRRIGLVAGNLPGDGTAASRRATALGELLALAGGTSEPYYYGLHANEGVPAFVRRTGCTAWWTINDHQALAHASLFWQQGLRLPAQLSLVGAYDTPWATGGALPLTTISFNPTAVAAALVDAARAYLAAADLGQPLASTAPRYVPPTLIVRASTATCPAHP